MVQLPLAVGAASGQEEYVRALWRPSDDSGSCNVTTLATGRASLTLALPRPTAVSVTGVPARMVPVGDPAAAAGQATSANLVVTLAFETGPSRAMTLDPRTVYDDSAANGVYSLSVSGSAVRVIAESPGTALLRVGFSNVAYENVSTEVTVTVTASDRLTLVANPTPAYTGSTSVVKPPYRCLMV